MRLGATTASFRRSAGTPAATPAAPSMRTALPSSLATAAHVREPLRGATPGGARALEEAVTTRLARVGRRRVLSDRRPRPRSPWRRDCRSYGPWPRLAGPAAGLCHGSGTGQAHRTGCPRAVSPVAAKVERRGPPGQDGRPAPLDAITIGAREELVSGKPDRIWLRCRVGVRPGPGGSSSTWWLGRPLQALRTSTEG